MSYLSRIIDQSNGADRICLTSLERGLKDVIKESETASNALLSHLLYLTHDPTTQTWPLAAQLVDESPEDGRDDGGQHLSLGESESSDEEEVAPAPGVAAPGPSGEPDGLVAGTQSGHSDKCDEKVIYLDLTSLYTEHKLWE